MVRALQSILNVAAIAAVAGCAEGFLGIGDSDATFRAQGESFTLTTTAGGVRGEIPFEYTNETGRTLFVQNCNRIVPPVLEKRIDGEWVTVWGAAVPECLSEPIVIRNSETYRDTLNVFAAATDANIYPKFLVPQIDGTYRMRWENVYWSAAYPGSEQIPRELRTSREFQIQVED